ARGWIVVAHSRDPYRCFGCLHLPGGFGSQAFNVGKLPSSQSSFLEMSGFPSGNGPCWRCSPGSAPVTGDAQHRRREPHQPNRFGAAAGLLPRAMCLKTSGGAEIGEVEAMTNTSYYLLMQQARKVMSLRDGARLTRKARICAIRRCTSFLAR